MGHEASKANDRAKQAARKQRRFIREQYDTRYQKTMADMHAAGLNPILAYQQGVGNAGGGAAAATFMGEGEGSLMSGIGSLLGAGAGVSQAKSQKKLRGLQGDLTIAQTGAQGAAGRQSDSQTLLNEAARIGAIANARQVQITNEFLELERPKREREAAFHESGPGRALSIFGMGAREIGPAVTGAAGLLIGRGLRRPGPGQSRARFGRQDDTRMGGTKGMTKKQAAQYEKWMNTWKAPRPGPNYRGRGK